MRRLYLSFIVVAMTISAMAVSAQTSKLTGIPFGSPSVDYNTGLPTGTVNQPCDAFDGDMSTFYASDQRSRTFVGLDLGSPHVITRVGWSPRNDYYGPGRVVLGVFQGANSADFMDALPLYIITETGVIGTMHYADVDCSRGFRYVRYVGPADARCNIAELEFYGTEGEGDDSHLYQLTNLPTVIINTVDAQEPFDKETNIESNIIILDNNTINVQAAGGTRERGNASRSFPKKPWRIKFDKKQTLLDAPAKAKKWTLINNYGDKTLMRNIVGFEISRRMGMPYTPFIRPVDVVMNGEYKGCYQLCDQVELAAGRIEGTEMGPTDVEGDPLTGAYHIEIDNYANQEISWFASKRGIPVTIKSPDDDEIVPAQSSYIEQHFNAMESAAMSAVFTHPVKGYRRYIDTDTWFRHMLVEEIVANPDQLSSIHCIKPRGDNRIAVAAIWDLDIAFDNDIRFPGSGDMDCYMWERCFPAGYPVMALRDLYRRIMESDPASQSDIRTIWNEVRHNGGISDDELQDYITGTMELMEKSQRLNFMRWPILGEKVHNNYQALGSWENEVDWLRGFVTKRLAFLDKAIGYDPDYSSIADVEQTHADGEIYAADGRIYTVSFAPATTYCVYNTSGQLVGSGECGIPSRMLPDGLYIVKAGTHTVKVVI